MKNLHQISLFALVFAFSLSAMEEGAKSITETKDLYLKLSSMLDSADMATICDDEIWAIAKKTGVMYCAPSIFNALYVKASEGFDDWELPIVSKMWRPTPHETAEHVDTGLYRHAVDSYYIDSVLQPSQQLCALKTLYGMKSLSPDGTLLASSDNESPVVIDIKQWSDKPIIARIIGATNWAFASENELLVTGLFSDGVESLFSISRDQLNSTVDLAKREKIHSFTKNFTVKYGFKVAGALAACMIEKNNEIYIEVFKKTKGNWKFFGRLKTDIQSKLLESSHCALHARGLVALCDPSGNHDSELHDVSGEFMPTILSCIASMNVSNMVFSPSGTLLALFSNTHGCVSIVDIENPTAPTPKAVIALGTQLSHAHWPKYGGPLIVGHGYRCHIYLNPVLPFLERYKKIVKKKKQPSESNNNNAIQDTVMH